MSYIYDFNPANECYQDEAGTIIAEVGDPIGNLPDSLGISQSVVQNTTARKPTLGLSSQGHRAIVSDGVDDALYTDGAWGQVAQPTIHVAIEHSSIADNDTPMGSRSPVNAWAFQVRTGTPNLSIYTWETGTNSLKSFNVNVPSLSSGTHVLSLRNDGTASKAWVDGVSVGSVPCVGILTPASALVVAGYSSGGAESYAGKILRAKYDNTAQSDAQVVAEATALLNYYSSPPPTAGDGVTQPDRVGFRGFSGFRR